MEKTSVVLFRYIFFFEHVAKHVRNVNKHTFMLITQIMSMILVSLRRHRAYRGQSALSAWWRNSGERMARLCFRFTHIGAVQMKGITTQWNTTSSLLQSHRWEGTFWNGVVGVFMDSCRFARRTKATASKEGSLQGTVPPPHPDTPLDLCTCF